MAMKFVKRKLVQMLYPGLACGFSEMCGKNLMAPFERIKEIFLHELCYTFQILSVYLAVCYDE